MRSLEFFMKVVWSMIIDMNFHGKLFLGIVYIWVYDAFFGIMKVMGNGKAVELVISWICLLCFSLLLHLVRSKYEFLVLDSITYRKLIARGYSDSALPKYDIV